MRTRVPLFVLAAFLLCVHGACRRSADARTLATVDSLLSVNDSLIKGMRALDLERVAGIDERFASRAERITALLRDTLRKEDALVLGNYHRTMTRYPRFVQEGSGSVVPRLERCRGQLQDLRSDLAKGLLDADQGTRYIQDERLALAEVRRDAERVATSVKTIFRNEAAYGAAVDSLLAMDTTSAR
jgi:hypothetical protein